MNDAFLIIAAAVLLLAVFGLGYVAAEHRLQGRYTARLAEFQAQADSAQLRAAQLEADLEAARATLDAVCPPTPERLAASYQARVRTHETTVFN